MSQPALRIVADDELPPHKRRVTWKAGPSRLVLGPPQAPRRLTLGLSVECVWSAWPWWRVLAFVVSVGLALFVLTVALISVAKELAS